MPRVSVRNAERKPMRPARRHDELEPRAAEAEIRHLDQLPRRSPRRCVTAPTYASGTSTITRSTGSLSTPSTSFTTTSGLPSASS